MTVADLLSYPALQLRPVAGTAGLNRSVSWAYVSELDDPTPWLLGAEMITTTGLAMPPSAAGQRAYLERLDDAGGPGRLRPAAHACAAPGVPRRGRGTRDAGSGLTVPAWCARPCGPAPAGGSAHRAAPHRTEVPAVEGLTFPHPLVMLPPKRSRKRSNEQRVSRGPSACVNRSISGGSGFSPWCSRAGRHG
ncbi:PucR family transcriptional regulator ligand-binding domain-containing protein [Streptomyces sp. NPDC055400]